MYPYLLPWCQGVCKHAETGRLGAHHETLQLQVRQVLLGCHAIPSQRQDSTYRAAAVVLRWYRGAEMVRGACAGGAAARASAVRSRVRSAGARQRKGASGYGDSSSSAVPQQLHHNDEVRHIALSWIASRAMDGTVRSQGHPICKLSGLLRALGFFYSADAHPYGTVWMM